MRSSVTSDDCQSICELTKEQADSDDWHLYRTDRITASRFGEVLSYRGSNPHNYITRSSYPTPVEIKAAGVGKDHESIAREIYIQQCKKEHTQLKVNLVCLVIDPDIPYLGASPDGLICTL